ncbi:MAG: class I SAM-dependent methyltransferase [Planctomycetales bacterium]|nr:class I SAM-dependent methyltransferase [Planctomycetales bacterium]MCA9163066.1 class I SAM-dependent methyltransferase [Planctomycetales bacterium]
MTLARQLEPEVMDTPEEAREYDEMDHSAVNQAFVADMLSSDFVVGDVLDLGTGTARIPIELCRRCEDCRVMAVDLSAYMLDLAMYNLEVAGLTHRIELQQIDSKDMPFADNMFDTVMSNSIIHHIADPSSVFYEAIRVTKPGGRLFFRDLARPTDQDELRRLVDLYAGSESDHARQLFEQSLHAALTVGEVRALLAPLGYAAATVQMTSDRHWTWTAVRE